MDRTKQNLDKLIGFAVTLVFLLLAGASVIRSLEWTAYGWGVRITPARAPDSSIAVIAIDDFSLQTLGNWPWNRDRFTELTKKLNRAGVRWIGYDVELDKAQNDLSLEALRNFNARYRTQLNETARKLLNRVTNQLDTDKTLAQVFNSSNVILGMPYTALGPPAKPVTPAENLAQHFVADVRGNPLPIYEKLPEWLHPDKAIYFKQPGFPVDQLAKSAKGLGLSHSRNDIDGITISRPAVLPVGKQFLPSFALLLAAAKTGELNRIGLLHGEGIVLGDRLIPTDSKFRSYPFYYKSKDNLPPFPVYSFAKVLNGEIRDDVFADKVVLVGPTSEQLIEPQATPLGITLPPVLIEAHTVSSYLQDHWYSTPWWTYWLRYIIFALVAFYLSILLPRLRFGTGLAITALILVVMFNVHFVLMALAGVWLALMAPAAALLVGNFLLGAKSLVMNRVERYRHELSKSNRLLAQAYQFQGQLDLAFEKYRSCDMDDELLSLTYNLGLDYERKRQFNKAANVFRFIRSFKTNYRDAKDRIQKNLQTSHAVVLGKPTKDGENTLIIAKNGMQKPMLGRYQIESEIGHGAMGTVYLGSDPKIGRTVAIKTMPLSSEFEEDQLEEVKQRFFREAKTAGRLNHYNIVTIYDVGEEQDLAYIAMDFLQGVDMAKFAKKDNLLKVSEVFSVMIQVADGLNYAHAQNVVHRDIKPANIIYDRRTKKPTITDFGVAHLTDTSKTKTGMILGTPSFMSPEQLAGRSIDGRSDLFSLGATFFQLLTGELPFTGESISSLMYKITNKPPRDILKLRPALPICVKAVIAKALQKEPEKRYQTGAEFIAAIKRCQQNIVAQQASSTGQRKAPNF
ncbi:MAG: CHASE2 domain-containing protein [Gammaproteobacteria bacterium]|nr:CHASE2 domain-containing protein [Gammaproteobacteria bacterium]